MASKAQTGVLLLADISGFTRFLAETELEHAHDILSEILQLVVKQLTPALTLAEVEGDAVFAYAPLGRFPRGETLLELIEQTYGLFLGRVEAIRLHTTCTCSACSAIPILDLKFIAHTGEYILQTVGSGGKPLGSAINLAHRLLKNHVEPATGWRAYGLITEAAARQLDLPTDGMLESVEHYENFDPVRTYSFDLRQRWETLRETRRVRLDPSDADLSLSEDLAAPPHIVWDWLNDPGRRSQWFGLENTRTSPRLERSGVGTTTHCTHGAKLESIHTIVDWRPFDYFTEEIARPTDGRPIALNTVELEPVPGGTRLHSRFRVVLSPRLVTVPLFRREARDSSRQAMARLRSLLAALPPAETLLPSP